VIGLFVAVVAFSSVFSEPAREPPAPGMEFVWRTWVPNPYRHAEEPIIGPAPEPVMEQVFWVELNVAPEVEAKVTPPEGVKLLDKTKPGKGRKRTRLYFRSDRGIPEGEIRIEMAGRKPAAVPLRVLTYREDIEEKIKAVPGIDPTARKQGRSYYTDEMIAGEKELLRKTPTRKGKWGMRFPERFAGLTDEELFRHLPSWSLPRQSYGTWPCPYCGDKILQKSAYYPYLESKEHPFKVKCPICERLFPSNDYGKDDFTSGEFPDDGWGCDPGSGKREEFAGWVGYYNRRFRWEPVGKDLHRLAMQYLLLGNDDAAHKAGVLLCRMAYIYPGMNMRWQLVRPRYRRRGRLFQDGAWERRGILVWACRAYDAIFDYLDKDTRLVEFLKKRDPAIKSPADVKALIETYLIQAFGWDWLRRELSGGMMGGREVRLAHFAVCANMGAVSDRWIEELFTHAYNSGADKGGFDDEVLINTTTREGAAWRAALSYSYEGLKIKSEMAEILSRLNSPRWRARSNLYDARLYPKFRAEFETWMDFIVAGQFAPNYGDSGGPQGARFPKGIPARLRREYENAYRHWPTDRMARALYRTGRRTMSFLFDEKDVWPEVEAHVKRVGPEPPLQSRVMDGVGFVFLESRSHATNLKERAGVALRYGYGVRGHRHHDTLNLEIFARGLSVAPELGYPAWTHPMGGTSRVSHHNTGMIDRVEQYRNSGSTSRGDLEMFASAPEASFADVSARPDGFPNRMYRRAVCLADAPGGNVYLVDIFRMAGGTARTFCSHGPPHEHTQSNLEYRSVPAGPAVPDDRSSGFGRNIIERQTAASDQDAWTDWKYLKETARMRLTLLGHPGRRYLTAKCGKIDIPPIGFFFAEDEEKDGASEFVALWEPYEGKPFIEKIERLPVQGAKPGEFSPAAIRLTLPGGQIDTFIYTHQPDAHLRCGDIEFKGSFGYWSELNGKLRSLHLVNGEFLRRGKEGVGGVPAPFRAKITAVDYQENTITLDRELPDEAADPKGRLVYIRAGKHRTAYHFAEILQPGNVARLDLNAIIYRSKMMSVGEDERHLVCEIPLPIEAARQFKPGYYDGATLTGEDLKAAYHVVAVKNDRVFLDRAIDEKDFPDTDQDGRRMVSIYDYGPGDEVAVHWSIFRTFQ